MLLKITFLIRTPGCSVTVARVLREDLVPVQIWTARIQEVDIAWVRPVINTGRGGFIPPRLPARRLLGPMV